MPYRSHCSEPYPDHDCWTATKKAAQNPPLLFDLNKDPSEVYELSPKDPEYNSIMDTMKNVSSSVLYLSSSLACYSNFIDLANISESCTFYS